jgi:hypothetical protein
LSNVVCVTLWPAVSHVNLDAVSSTCTRTYLCSCGTVCDVDALCKAEKEISV